MTWILEEITTDTEQYVCIYRQYLGFIRIYEYERYENTDLGIMKFSNLEEAATYIRSKITPRKIRKWTLKSPKY